MSNYKTHLDAAKLVCLTALHHLDHGLIVAVKQHSGSVVDDPSEPARIILTLELEALDLPATNNDHHRDDKLEADIFSLHGSLLDEAKRRVMDDVMSAKPMFMGRGSRLATGEESGEDYSLRKLDTSKLNDVAPVPKWVTKLKVPALDSKAIRDVLGRVLDLSDDVTDNIVNKLLEAQNEALRGDE